jgi:uracil-DNA glycosylase
MRAGNAYHDECRAFLAQQIAIVQPRLIAALGAAALEQLQSIDCKVHVVGLLHPGALTYVRARDRDALVEREAAKLRDALPRSDVGTM